MQLVELDISDSNKEIEFFIDQLYLELFGKDALLSNEDKVAIKNQWQKQFISSKCVTLVAVNTG